MEAFDPSGTGDTLLTDGRININAASDAVLLAIPGLSVATVALVRRLRGWDRSITSLNDLAQHLPPSAQDSLRAHWAELSARLVFSAGSLVLTARGWAHQGGHGAWIDAQIAPVGDRVGVLRRRLR